MEDELDLCFGRLRWWAREREAEARLLRIWNGSEAAAEVEGWWWVKGERGRVIVLVAVVVTARRRIGRMR